MGSHLIVIGTRKGFFSAIIKSLLGIIVDNVYIVQ